MTTTGAKPTATEAFLTLLRDAIQGQTFIKLTLSSPRGPDKTLVNVFVRPVTLQAGERFSFVHRHKTCDVTKNFTMAEAIARIEQMLGTEFRHAHCFTKDRTAKLELRERRNPRLVIGGPTHTGPRSTAHDNAKERAIAADRPWLRGLGVTGADGKVVRGMESKFRQINKFVEILASTFDKARLKPTAEAPCSIVDMGCGKGYLTFAAYDWLNRKAEGSVNVRGIEARAELVELCNRVAQNSNWAGLKFERGDIADASIEVVDGLIALHACDTATDDAIAGGIRGGARLILVSPCCHKEVRSQLVAPSVLEGALRHGILLERHAEFVTDALRAGLLEWAGYDTRVFEFVSSEHTGKNLMIAATKRTMEANARAVVTGNPARGAQCVWNELAAGKVRDLAAFYGIRTQRLARRLDFPLVTGHDARC